MSNKPDGGCAFPCNWIDTQPDTGIQVVREQYSGMSVRQYYKAAALIGILSSAGPLISREGKEFQKTPELVASFAGQYADEMIKEDK